MRIFLSFIFLLNIAIANDYGNYLPDPFSKKKKINFSYNDISNYPIGIFDLNKDIDETVFTIDRDFSKIQIKSFAIGYHNIFFYQDTFENYISDLIESNQRYNLLKGLNAPSDSTSSKKDTFLQLASIDLGALGRASLKVAGNVNLSAKLVNQDQELVRSSFREQEKTNFKFDQKQQLNVQGKIGDRITVSLDQNSERDFDWENTIRIDYQGEEDDILQRLEVGNISLSLPSTEFVTFSGTNNGLFGVKALSQLGPVNITSIASIEKTEKESQQYKGSSELRTIELKDFNYKKNLYFFVHEWFRNGTSEVIESSNFQLNIPSFYPLIDGLHSIGNVSIKNFELYKIDSSNNPQADPGIAYINPSEKDQFSDESKQGNFLKLNRGTDYTINEDLGFIRMKKTLQSEIIAAHFDIIDRATGTLVTRVGQSLGPNQDSLELIMIKSQSPHPNHPAWDLMFKNVYSLNTTNIDATSLEVQIVDNFSTPKSDRLSSGETFLNLFGLDELNQNGEKSQDEIIDYNNPNIVNIQSGEILLPSLLPFVSENSILGGNSNESLEPLLQQGVMYTSTNITQYTGDSRFSILVRYSSPQQSINLGFTLVEGSEEIFSNGNQLLKGRDYQIDYFSGTITLSENINPDDDLRISYDKHDLVSFDRKIMAGSRAQIDFDENSFLGMTALYYDQSIVNKKVEVGYEPIQNFIWDINGRYETYFENFAGKVNKLNFLDNEKMSNFSVEGEFAQVLPNPNSISNSRTGDKNGVAFIDDFEGSKRVTSPSILRRFWNISSAPLSDETLLDYSQNNRMKMYWYNPYSQVLTNSIWPNVSTSQRAQNITTDVLVLKYNPQDFQSNVDADSLWAGITSPMFIGDYDQTRSRFFEIWLRGDDGDLTIDLGKISEDYDGNGLLNTEDVPDAGLALGNGFLEDNEDTGLDGCFDDFENGFGTCLDTSGLTYLQYLEAGESILINNSFDVDIQDPNGDNWSYDEGSNDYSKVNGTEGNGTGSKIQTGGKYPDSEDLDKSGYLDRANNYYTKKVSLNDNTYVAGETEIDGIKTGWKLFRIPISHFSQINDISLSEIKYVRLVVSGVEEDSKLEIAKMELVGNNWQELGTSIQSENNYTLQDSTFVVSVINDEDNPDYIPPKGVVGEFDEINQLRSKEQSLVLKFESLPPNYKGAAKKILSYNENVGQSFLMYDKMKMFIYGNSDYVSDTSSNIRLFIKFGNGDEFYKLTKPIYAGWDEELKRNEIDLDLDWLTSLKNKDNESIDLINSNDIFKVDDELIKYEFISDDNNSYKNIEIVGNPSLSRLQYFIIGIENASEYPITGEVWTDELRLSGVKKESGTAVRLKTELNISDFSSTTINYSKKDADFHVLQERIGTNSSTENLSLTNNLRLGNLFPSELGISFPLTISYNNSTNTPKFFPGTDIRTESSAPDSILVQSSTMNVSGRLSKKIKSENPVVKYTLDNLSAGFNISNQNRSDTIMKSIDFRKINTNLDYFIRFPSGNFIEPFEWIKSLPYLGDELSSTKLYYSPTNFSSNIKLDMTSSERNSRANSEIIKEENFNITRNFGFEYKVFDDTQLSYNKSIVSNKLDDIFKEFEIGEKIQSKESFSYNFSPEWMKILNPSFNYDSNFSWNKPPDSIIDAANINLNTNTRLNITVSPKDIISIFYNPSTIKDDKPRTRSRTQTLRFNNASTNTEENKFLKKVYDQTKKIDPISITFTNTNNSISNGINGKIPFTYKLGLKDNLGIDPISEIGFDTGFNDKKISFAMRTSIRFKQNSSLNISFNQNINSNINGFNIDTRSSSTNYLAYGKNLSKGMPFINWNLRVRGLENIFFIKPYVKSMSLEHAFSGNQNLSWKFNDDGTRGVRLFNIEDFRDDYQDSLQFSKTISSLNPLLGITTRFNNDISTNIRLNTVYTLDEVPFGRNIITKNSLLGTMSYNFARGLRISLPFTERNVFLRNNFNITFNFDLNNTVEKGSKNMINFVEQNFIKTRKGILRLSYVLTDDLTAGLFYEYRTNETRLTGQRIDRDFGITLNISIRG